MTSKIISTLLLSLILISCDKNEPAVDLVVKGDSAFNGTFETTNSDNISGTVDLQISNGHYYCTTSLPYGRGAGKIILNGSKITFKDTLFVAVPALYSSAYVLSGTHEYDFDGTHLKVWRKKNVGEVAYQLKLKN